MKDEIVLPDERLKHEIYQNAICKLKRVEQRIEQLTSEQVTLESCINTLLIYRDKIKEYIKELEEEGYTCNTDGLMAKEE